MSHPKSVRRLAAAALAGAAGAASLAVGTAAAAPAAAACSDVEVVFARGTGELPGLGIVGTPLVSAIKSNLPGKSVSSYGVDYAADYAQLSAGAGATDMSDRVRSVAASCPNTSFVIGGYSQGASVTDIAIGIPTLLGSGGTIPANLAPRVKAVVVYGNPLRLYGQTVNSASRVYGPKAKDICNAGDPVCGAGANFFAHLSYPLNGTVDEGARFAAGKVRG
ncbi:cutinase family protein [Actinomadura sp. LOL_016]|uniref:cutinase family protein n=1 Tax=unclassified Actinomadura TaxID=2626254 RepID=UPI003A7F6A90